ncbi:MAG: hypothetical protein EX271_03075 [Acidimicrobiales bacterium]|nr:hypothetical protein [Hyphomonadaceae bacterium]RZV43865.1 MAG: hypothetical protein EX271_03075 [Acidimicrobiales bacterium]
MNTLTKLITIGGLALFTACGNTTEAPTTTPSDASEKTDPNADVRASLATDASLFDVHLAALKQITDDLNAINTMDDAMRLKKRIAANVSVMKTSFKKYAAQPYGNKSAETDAFRVRQDEYETAMENYSDAMQTLGEKDPKLWGFIADELSIMPRKTD